MKTLFVIGAAMFLMLGAMACSGNGEANEAKGKIDTQTEVTADENAVAKAPDPADQRSPIRNEANQIVTIETDFGKMVLELYHDVAPAHADSFAARTTDGFYNGLTFHRIVDGFMIQGGDPQGTGMGNAGYYLPAEFSNVKHVDGTLSMARSQDPNSASCQFFICLGPTPFLDGKYTVFGQLLKGYDVLHAIGKVETVAPPHNPREKSKPVTDVKMRKLYLSDAEGNPLE
ncbi:MAG: peptidylprolyl isomerase [bacterium]